MELIHYLLTSIFILNIIGFLGSLFFSESQEKLIKYYCFSIVSIVSLHLLILSFLHTAKHFPAYNIYISRLFHHKHYSFDINFLWNTTTWIFLITGNIITLLILYFSGYYMHRENGYKRFFNTLMFFYFAYNIVVSSGNFTTLFIGWEYLGISSFLLIAFYRDRYLPVRNAVKIFSVYRIGDIGLIISVWALHQLVHDQVLFYNLKEHSYVLTYFDKNYWVTLFIGLGILIAAIGKSALFPFSYWLPRAMEGPTGSSAIFYGALSVHAGILLLLKTYYLWSEIHIIRMLMIIIGLITYFTANKSAKLQSSIKPQIAYSSIAQIGIMLVELAWGLRGLVHIHFVSNAFLRTYQLLVSPSIAAYVMKQQIYYSSFIKIKKHFIHYLPERYYYTLYTLAQHEWYLDNLINNFIFSNIKKLGKSLKFINEKSFAFLILPFFILALYVHEYRIHLLQFPEKIFASILAIIAVLLIFRAFSERFKPFLVLYLIFFSELFIALSVSYNERYDVLSFLIYLSGLFPGFIGAWICLIILQNREPHYFNLNKYYGHVFEHRWLAFIFLICILNLMGFPISLTFMGEDIIINHIHPHQLILATAFAIHFIFTGITGIKIYARLFLGPHCKNYHEKSIKAG